MDLSFKKYIAFSFFLLISSFLLAQGSDIEQNRKEFRRCVQANDNNKAAFYLNKIAFAYSDLNKKDSAIFYFLEGAKYNDLVNNKAGVKSAYANIAAIYADNKQLAQAIEYAKKSLAVRKQIGKKSDICAGLIEIAGYLENQKKHAESNKYLDEALDIASGLNDARLMRNCFEIYTSNYKALGQHEKSQEAFSNFSTYNQKVQLDELAQKEKQTVQNANFKISKADSLVQAKQAELLEQNSLLSSTKDSLSFAERLNKEKEEKIENLNKDRLLKEAVLKQKEAQLQKSAIIRNFIIFGLILVLIFVTLILNNMRKLKKAKNVLAMQNAAIATRNKEIKQQKNDIEKKTEMLESAFEQIKKQNLDINNSINYAQRIQKAMLRSEDALKVYLPESFIFLRPREKVSGDFFWFKEIGSMAKITRYLLEAIGEKPEENDLKNKKLILAAVDCTGHGVPGSFMSLIGFNLLNEITSMGFTKSAANILNHLHESVRGALRQDTTDNRDGMDVALCLIDKNNMVLDFAGAKNPLVYIRNGELFEIKGDKNPVGGLQREEERKFVSHKLALDTPTVFYIFSDGYLDQFGGEKGRKFMKKNFYSLLLEIHQKPMDEQKEILFKTFKDWKGEQAQIDDVLVIGFKI